MPRRGQDGETYVDLGAPEHEWWAKRPTDPFAPVEPDPDLEPEERDAAAAHGGEPDGVDDDVEPGSLDAAADPYAVLRLPSSATWEEIVASYRRLARWWHPDGLGAAAEWGREACEAKIRQLNAAYSELRVMRGR